MLLVELRQDQHEDEMKSLCSQYKGEIKRCAERYENAVKQRCDQHRNNMKLRWQQFSIAIKRLKFDLMQKNTITLEVKKEGDSLQHQK